MYISLWILIPAIIIFCKLVRDVHVAGNDAIRLKIELSTQTEKAASIEQDLMRHWKESNCYGRALMDMKFLVAKAATIIECDASARQVLKKLSEDAAEIYQQARKKCATND